MRLLVALAGLFALAVLVAPVGRSELPPGAYKPPETLWEGKSAREWAHIARVRDRQLRQARKDSAARGRTIRRYKLTVRRLIYTAPWGNHWLERAFLCIHGFEGSWSDPNAPHWGGLQMDRSFMGSYGAEYVRAFGTADRWPVAVQIAVAIKAYLSGRGFHPWPNTARRCGLI